MHGQHEGCIGLRHGCAKLVRTHHIMRAIVTKQTKLENLKMQ